MSDELQFEVVAPPADATGDALLVGYALPGMASLSATNQLVTDGAFTEIGHVRARGLPAIAPFSEGRPRYPVRLYDHPDASVTVLLSELFVPVPAAAAFADGLFAWLDDAEIAEIAILHGVPYPHGPEDHSAFVTATQPYHDDRLDGTDVRPLNGGFLDGIAGELTLRGMEHEQAVGTLVTPSHPPGPDLEAAIRLLDVVERLYGVTFDRSAMEQQAEATRRYYAEMADRMQALEEKVGAQDYPEDRMFM